MSKFTAAKLLTKKNVLRYGATFTAGSAVGNSIGAVLYGAPGQRRSNVASAAVTGATVGAGITAAILGRKTIGRFVKGGMREVVAFRRIRGRVFPIFGKKSKP